MRILLINPNTSPVVSAKVLAGARAAASPDTHVEVVTGDFGASVVSTRTENAIAAHSAVALAARHAAGYDAVVIAMSYDTGAGAVRELLDVPVVGITEAALHTACMLGAQIGVVAFGRRVLPLYRELVAGYGLAGRIAGWRVIESTAAYAPGDDAALDRALVEAACGLVEHDGAEVVVLTGAVMAGVPERLQPEVPVPLLDGIGCGVRQAETLVRLAPRKPRTGSYAPPGRRKLAGVDPAIASRLGGEA
jgi:allantoin racemase